MNNNFLWEAQKSIEHILNEVANRGWKENPLNVDQFAELRKEQRIREAIIAALYEQYFLPERHEFEWQILSETVNVVVASPATRFAGEVIAGGIIGNAAYDLLKKMCSYVVSKMEEKLGEEGGIRAQGFRQIVADAEKLKKFFSVKSKARIQEIEKATGVPRERLYPLMKLAGLNHYRRGDFCYWEMPSV